MARFLKNVFKVALYISVVQSCGALFGKHRDKKDVSQFGRKERNGFWKTSLARMHSSAAVERTGALFEKYLVENNAFQFGRLGWPAFCEPSVGEDVFLVRLSRRRE